MKTTLFALAALFAFAAQADVELPSDRAKFRLVLLIGQSNMAGRGIPTAADKVAHPRVVMLDRDERWVPCIDPIHFDKKVAGSGVGKTFAEALAESDRSIMVGVVPCAVGGTSVAKWLPDAKQRLFVKAVKRAKAALEKGTLAAILWHQGESDMGDNGAAWHQWRLPVVMEAFRRELGAEWVPLIIGGLDPAHVARPTGKTISNTERWTCEYYAGPGRFVPCPENCGLMPDGIHLDRDTQVEFGKRYYAAYEEVVKKLAQDPGYWKNPESDAAKIKAYVPVYRNPKNRAALMDGFPPGLPERLEKWLFPNGRDGLGKE